MAALLVLDSLTKTYPGVVANSAVSLEVGQGEIHALLGENGAGKSTLVRMIYGLVRPDSGTMTLDGAPFMPLGPQAARTAGIGMVFQHFSLFDALNVAENVALGMDATPPNLAGSIRKISTDYGLALEPDRLAGDLSAGERQRVEIVRCLLQKPRLMVMDEPTSVLAPQEADRLFQTLRRLRAEGMSILYISHRLREIRHLCDRATILRRGKVAGICIPAEESVQSIAGMVVGTQMTSPAGRVYTPGKVLLSVTQLSLGSDDPFGPSLKDVRFDLHAGEVLGIAGVAGNGQNELLAALSGEARTQPGAILMKGEPVGDRGPDHRRLRGLLAAPEERLGHAAVQDMSLTENALLTGWQGLHNRGFINWGAATSFARAVIERFDVRPPNPANAAKVMSGGNLQKFLIGREILQHPEVFVVNQPTWGVDAAAAAAIRTALLELADNGAGVVVISHDLDELMQISDNFAVLAGGQLSPVQRTSGVTAEDIGVLMGGTHATA
ncbi:MAG: ABC transporter ATP-binding protein [Rhodobacteraceae bacterium]|nr:ABC transporter ATP-binding protein [Paracoccaceae bacterium]